ncbi:DUF397 domain-containing protein [Kitasatospora sp. NBC_01287]|uniref:DUF397 domain-containing protein n=1 Tax=Kitasatospora sp. NBC_01287 TaxID=2903573 RepID=UPI002252F809|nr:DUF397 domain-containing protein [Kitasatospora sp. NBC_01287]MCX4750046.1 DUF397 domain-containing protein [Kitasatospora sp. NBC_01287]
MSTAHWFKAKASETAQGCSEVAFLAGAVALRDSKRPELPAQVYPAEVWASWLTCLREGRYVGHRVELSFVGGGVTVRDSADPAGQIHAFTQHEFECFLNGVRGREFDLAC